MQCGGGGGSDHAVDTDIDSLTTVCSNASDSSMAKEHTPFTIASLTVSAVILLLSLLGILGNLISAFIFSRRMMRSPINILLVGLALLDCAVCALGTFVFSTLSCYEYIRKIEWGEHFMGYVSVYVYPLAMTAQTGAIWMLIVLTFERFVAVALPLRAKSICTTGRSMCACLLTVLFAFFYNFVRFWEHEIQVDPDDNVTKSIGLLRIDSVYMSIYVFWMYLVTQFIIPFAVLVVVNSYIIVAIRRSKKQHEKLTRRESREHKTATMMVLIIVVFISCNSLAFVLNVLEIVSASRIVNTAWFYFLSDVNNALVITNSAVNALIYYHFSRKYRHYFRYLFPCVICQNAYDLPATDSSIRSRAKRSVASITCSSSGRSGFGKHSTATLLAQKSSQSIDCSVSNELASKFKLLRENSSYLTLSDISELKTNTTAQTGASDLL